MACTKPQTIAQVLNWLESRLSLHDLEALKNTRPEDIGRNHIRIAIAIQTTLNHWSMNAALRKEYPGLHPDDVSMVVLEQLWKKLNDV